MQTDWDSRYRSGDTPWDSGSPSAELQKVLQEYGIPCSRALDLGCGTGSNCVYLAGKGFDVTGVDIAAPAIEAAQQRLNGQPLTCRFLVADVFHLPDLGSPFPLIFDRGCFHVVRQADEAGIVDVFDRWLAPGGRLLVLTGNANDTDKRQDGPPKATDAELRRAFAGRLKIEHLREFHFDTQPGREFHPLGWSLLLRKA
jgi:methyl halide transferase